MKCRNILWLGFALLMLLSACTVDLPLPEGKGEQKIALFGEMIAGDTVLIRAGQSHSLNTPEGESKLIKGLNLILTDNNGADIVLTGIEDDMSGFLYTTPYSSPQLLTAGGDYKITGKHGTLPEASVNVHIPEPFSNELLQKKFTNYVGDSVVSLEFEITDAIASQHQYVIEVMTQPVYIYGYFYLDGNQYPIVDNQWMYDSLKLAGVNLMETYDTTYSGSFNRLEFYSNDASCDNPTAVAGGRRMRRLFLQGAVWGSASHRTKIFIPRSSIYGMYVEHAETIINIKSVAADYYNFLKAYDQYNPSQGLSGPNSENMGGNVKGGYGMVGGVFRRSVKFIH